MRQLLGIDEDKWKHFGVCFVLTVLLYSLTKNIYTALLMTFSVGVLKEVIDGHNPNNKFDVEDIIADLIGMTAGVLFVNFGIWVCSL